MAFKMAAIIKLKKSNLNLFSQKGEHFVLLRVFGVHSPILVLFLAFIYAVITISKMATRCHFEK